MYGHLLSPVGIGSLRLRNRIAMAPMGVEIVGSDGVATEEVVCYYEERARGGVGLIITEVCAVAYPRGANSAHQLGASNDSFIPGLSELTARVKGHGAAIALQLVHHGKVSRLDIAQGREVLVPSPPDWHGSYDMVNDLTAEELDLMLSVNGGEARLRAADHSDIEQLVDDFASAAARAREAGFDGVEIHGAHGYLLSGFLSRQWNHRDDEYGGSIENRSRLLCDVISAVKSRAGADFPVWCRLDALEYRTPDGITFDDAQITARLAVEAGADAIHLSAYGDMTSGPAFTEGTLPHREATHSALTGHLKTQLDVPVIAVGRISPDTGEEMIAHGKADIIAMGRQMLADPAIVKKLSAGRAADIRPCINCYVCVAQPFFDRRVKCAVNPVLARELELSHVESTRTDLSRRVVVVGGGPAGMEAARIAAVRGHQVTLLEASGQLGGSLRFAALVYEPNRKLLTWMTHQMGVEGVDVRTSTAATSSLLDELRPEVVIVANGSKRTRPDIPGVDGPNVLDGDDLRALLDGNIRAESPVKLPLWARPALGLVRLLGFTQDPESLDMLSRQYMPIGKRVVVLGGGLVGVELADFLSERGRVVTVVERGPKMAPEMAHPRRWRVLEELRLAGVELLTNSEILAIDASTVTFRTDTGVVETPVDHVVIATGLEPDTSVADALRKAGFDPIVIGDAGGIGYIEGAIAGGFAAGLAVG